MLTLYCSKQLSDLLPDKLEKGEKDVVSLDAWYAHVETLGANTDFRMSELLSNSFRFTYLYVFGDGQEVALRVASAQEDYDQTFPICTAFEGDASPGDVGGVGGYMDFLDILADLENPEYEETM